MSDDQYELIMRKYASLFFTVLFLASGTSWASGIADGFLNELNSLNGPKKKGKKQENTESRELASADSNSEVTLEELEAILKEIDESEEFSEVDYLTEQLINVAEEYKGVRYRFGGTSVNGIDCSGLVKTAFDEFNISLPRSSREMAKIGDKVHKSDAKKGDLIFFKTRGSRISHVGIIVEVLDDDIRFIHSSTSKGVIISSVNEAYYKRTFAQINRVYHSNML